MESFIGGLAFITILSLFILRTRYTRKLPFPPGPKAKILSGNSHQMPKKEPWLVFTAWSKIYGPLVHFRIFNQRTIIINSAKVAVDLLDGRSAIYSDRHISQMLGELGGRKHSVFQMSYGDPRFKVYRRLLHSGLNPRVTHTYRPIQYQETRVFLRGLFDSPADFVQHIRRNAAAVISNVAYGYQVETDGDKFVREIEEGFRLVAASGVNAPGRYLVNTFPVLRFLPFPGASFKLTAKRLGERLSLIEQAPYEWAKKTISTGNYVDSFVSKRLTSGEITADDQENLKWCSASLYTASALTTFILLMTLHPDIQRRAQEEVDRVVGSDRLPTFEDRELLPYVLAIIKETLRLVHRLMQDDVYEGYLIPKGARVVANIWAITHDSDLYPDPSTFDPTRHLGENPQPDHLRYVFGYGRRVCPGAHFAELSLFLNIASILASFNISKAVDENGEEVKPSVGWTTGGTMHPLPFKCCISPRSKDITTLLDA
ncbi:cytochrome P450 [Infundibulicybe gibba]|nr:cytochrome P450 [Infundibulicybe gibba]